jgi:hypothetical protein
MRQAAAAGLNRQTGGSSELNYASALAFYRQAKFEVGRRILRKRRRINNPGPPCPSDLAAP